MTTLETDDLPVGTRKKCDHCDSTGADFDHNGYSFCCLCMASLCSWYLDGGFRETPEMFGYVLEPDFPNGGEDDCA